MITFIVIVVLVVAGCHCVCNVAGGIKKHAEHKEPTNLMKFVISIVGHCKIDKPIFCVTNIVVTVMANSYCTVTAEPEMIV